MADSVSLKAYAKINLNLDITGKTDDFHTVEMVLQAIDIYDTVTVSKDDEITVKCSDESLPSDENNIAFCAAKEFFSYTEINGGAEIKIKKRIPVAAGLGGGSSDAAAVVVALNMIYETHLEDDQLMTICENLGADVPFFINGATQLAEGKGTILTPLPDLPECTFVIIKNGTKNSTGEMYAKFDSLGEVEHPKTNELVEAICEGDLYAIAENCENVFENLYDSDFLSVKQKLIENGALAASLSGSGPSIFGLFETKDDAKSAKDALEDEFENIFICEPINSGFEE